MQQEPVARVLDSGEEGGRIILGRQETGLKFKRRQTMKKRQSRKETTLRRRLIIVRSKLHACAECGGKFKKKCILVDQATDIHTERKVCPLCQETLRNFNRNISQIHRIQGANHVCFNCG